MIPHIWFRYQYQTAFTMGGNDLRDFHFSREMKETEEKQQCR